MSTTLPCKDIVYRQPRLANRLVWTAVVLLVVGLPLAAGFAGWEGVFATIVPAISALVRAAQIHRRRRPGGAIALESDGLRIVEGVSNHLHVLPFAAIESGYVVPSDSAAVLRMRNGTELSLRLEGDGPARVLAHAGVGPMQRVLTMPLRRMLGAFTIGFISFWPAFVGWVMLAFQVLRSGSAFPLGALLAAFSTALVVWRFGFPRVVVGTDGIRVLGVLRPRFVPYEEIARVEVVPSTHANTAPSISVLRHKRSAIVLPTVAATREQIEGLAQRINDGAQAYGSSSTGRLDALSRGSRSVKEWRDDVTRIALAPPGFRDKSLGRDDFEHVLGDAAAPIDQRIGAALALRAIDPGGAPARIRIAADASADDDLRETLASASEGEIDDAMLVRASARRASR